MKLINYREVSKVLTGNPTTIRANNIPKKYLKQVEELQNILHYWLTKNKKQ